jgi:hypothetical protein
MLVHIYRYYGTGFQKSRSFPTKEARIVLLKMRDENNVMHFIAYIEEGLYSMAMEIPVLNQVKDARFRDQCTMEL